MFSGFSGPPISSANFSVLIFLFIINLKTVHSSVAIVHHQMKMRDLFTVLNH